MLTYEIKKDIGIPAYEQIYIAIKKDISSGIIKPNTKLPSKRSFAEHLGVSKVTVEAAYSQLIAEGYVYSIEKKGYFSEEVPIIFQNEKNISDRSGEYPAEQEKSESKSVGAELFPFSVWSKLMRETILNYGRELLSPLPSYGAFALRKAIADYLVQNRGMRVEPSSIIIGAGTEYLYGLIIQLLGFDKKIAVEDPSYGKITRIYSAHGSKSEYIEMDGDGISIDALNRSSADVVHISPAHHFPTGIVMPIKRRYDILRWASEKDGRYIIEDEYDSEFRFGGKPISPMFSDDANGKVIYINTFSKTISPSVRISYMILPSELEKRFREKLGFYSCTVAAFEQYTLAEFIGRGYFERHINRMKRYYRLIRDEMMNIISESGISEKVEILEPDSGLHFILKLKTSFDDEFLKNEFDRRKIKVSFLSDYYFNKDKAPENMMLVNYSVTEKECFKKIISCIREII